MQAEVVKATIKQKPVLANLLELYAYDFTEFCDFDISDDGFYGYERLFCIGQSQLAFLT